jgi:hypothetical protein
VGVASQIRRQQTTVLFPVLRILLLLLSLPMVALPAQGARFRFACRDDPDPPNAVRRRLRKDSASLRFYERVVQMASDVANDERATALLMLSWSAGQRYLPHFR